MACGGGEAGAPENAAAPGAAEAEGAANTAPRIERLRLEPAEPVPGEPVRALATVRDPDGDRTTQGFRWQVGGRELAASGSEIELHDAAKDDLIEVWVSASDGRAESEAAYAAVRVANRRPVLENVALQPVGSVVPGEPAVAMPLATDPDGDPSVPFRWTVDQAGWGQESGPTAGCTLATIRVVAEPMASESDAV
jgi:hypothetical protein